MGLSKMSFYEMSGSNSKFHIFTKKYSVLFPLKALFNIVEAPLKIVELCTSVLYDDVQMDQ